MTAAAEEVGDYVIGRPDDPRYASAIGDVEVQRHRARAEALNEVREAVRYYADAIAVVKLTRLIACAETQMADAIEAALKRAEL